MSSHVLFYNIVPYPIHLTVDSPPYTIPGNSVLICYSFKGIKVTTELDSHTGEPKPTDAIIIATSDLVAIDSDEKREEVNSYFRLEKVRRAQNPRIKRLGRTKSHIIANDVHFKNLIGGGLQAYAPADANNVDCLIREFSEELLLNCPTSDKEIIKSDIRTLAGSSIKINNARGKIIYLIDFRELNETTRNYITRLLINPELLHLLGEDQGIKLDRPVEKGELAKIEWNTYEIFNNEVGTTALEKFNKGDLLLTKLDEIFGAKRSKPKHKSRDYWMKYLKYKAKYLELKSKNK